MTFIKISGLPHQYGARARVTELGGHPRIMVDGALIRCMQTAVPHSGIEREQWRDWLSDQRQCLLPDRL